MIAIISLAILIAAIVAIVLVLKKYLGYEIVDLEDIEEEDEKDMLTLMGLDFIKRTIEISRIEIPKVYNNIFYKVYFSIFTDEDIISNNPTRFMSNALHLSFEKVGRTEQTVDYCCTISSYEKSGIALIRSINAKYLAMNKKTSKTERKKVWSKKTSGILAL